VNQSQQVKPKFINIFVTTIQFINIKFEIKILDMKNLLLLLFVVMLIPGQISAQNAHEREVLTNLDQFYEKTQKEWDIPGMSVAIVKDGKVIFSKGYGVKEAGKNDRPDGNTLYAIASNSKAFTATIIGQLVDEGKCTWDDKVQKHLPWFEVNDPVISSQVTLRDILSHRVGYGTAWAGI
jgi:CubicO group peptidase (beta-lactamase class C family)